MSNFIIILFFLGLGVLAKRLFTLPEKLPLLLNQLVINIAIPAVILLRIPQLSLSLEVLSPMFLAWLTVLVAALLVHFVGRKLNWSRAVIGALLMTAVLGNTSYLGFPMVKVFYGEQLLPYAIIFDQLGNFIALAVYGSLIISLYGNNQEKVNTYTIMLRILRFPPFIILLIALLIPADFLAQEVENILVWCAGAMVPLTMFIVGLQFSLQLDKHFRLPLVYGLGIKMILTPLIVAVIAINLPISADIAKVSVFESAMPPMVTAGVMAIHANLAPKLAAAMVGFGLFVGLLFLPVVFWLNNIFF